MPAIVVIGGGVVGMGAAMMLAADGHDVTLLERDPEPPPAEHESAWASWDRKGVNQFRLAHSFLARYRQVMEAELPHVVEQLRADGVLEANAVTAAPDFLTGGFRDGDERFSVITGRRSVMERSIAAAAQSTPGLAVERGVAVAGLVASGSSPALRVTGVRADDGRVFDADLVIDAGGRRSALPRWLAEIGAPEMEQEVDECGFVYYGRHYRSADGSLPFAFGPPLQEHGSISTLTLAADHGTWSTVIVTRADDQAMRGVTDIAAYERVFRSIPTVAHWLDAEPLEDRVVVMAKIEDRFRRFWPDGRPVVTGLVPVGDAWSCTNPSVGRGASIGSAHAQALRSTLRQTGLDDPAAFAEAFGEVTRTDLEPWYRTTLDYDRGRLDEMGALIAGEDPPEPTVGFAQIKQLQSSAMKDPDCFRASVDTAMVLRTPAEVLAEPALAAKVAELGAGWRDEPTVAPPREELMKLVHG